MVPAAPKREIFVIMATIAIVSLSIILFYHANIEPAHACSCIPPRPPIQMLEESDAVFSGIVVDKMRGSSQEGISTMFAVEKYWKGEPAQVVTVLSGPGNCGYGFEEGIKYLVYANGPGTLVTSICTGTKPISQAHDDMIALGAGNVVASAEGLAMVQDAMAVRKPNNPASVVAAFAAGTAVAVVAGVGVAVYRIKKKERLKRQQL